MWLGICLAIAFATGIYSHLAQDAPAWFPSVTRPVWLYRLSQGLHVASGTAAVPLLLVKLWSVYPKLFERVPRGELGRIARHLAERGSIAVLVAGSIFQVVTGLANSTQWYPWSFSFRAMHYAVGWITLGALVIHVAVKLPLIVAALRSPLYADDADPSSSPLPRELRDDGPRSDPAAGHLPAIRGEVPPAAGTPSGGLTRRGLLGVTGVAAGAAVLTTGGAAVPALRRISVFGVTTGGGPGGVPINRTAREADVVATALDPAFRLLLANGDQRRELSVDELAALQQVEAELPIACVEGWSASGRWSGVRMSTVLELVGADPESTVVVTSLQPAGAFRVSELPPAFTADPLTLLALGLDGEPLSLDHGYPCRLIAPNRPGVLETKWVRQLEVTT